MDSLSDIFDAIENRRKTLDVYTDGGDVAAELESQFSTRNVEVTHHQIPAMTRDGFVIIRAPDETFQATLGLDHFRSILSPQIHPPWKIEESAVDYEQVFDFLNNTVFTSYDRRQMLAITREIEQRAWRSNTGTLYVGFQDGAAFASQIPVYNRLISESELTATIYIEDDWTIPDGIVDRITIVTEAGEEIGRHWFVIFDGGGSDLDACALVARERDPGSFYGFWTNDSERVRKLISYLDSSYGG